MMTKSLTQIIVTAILMTSGTCLAQATDGGNGILGYFCKAKDGSIAEGITYDLWRIQFEQARLGKQLEYIEVSPENAAAKAKEILLGMEELNDRFLEKLQKNIDPVIQGIDSQLSVDAVVSVNRVFDEQAQVGPGECKTDPNQEPFPAQIVNYDNQENIWVNKKKFAALSAGVDRAAVYIHEVVYKTLRDLELTGGGSYRTQKITAYLLSKLSKEEKVEYLFEALPEGFNPSDLLETMTQSACGTLRYVCMKTYPGCQECAKALTMALSTSETLNGTEYFADVNDPDFIKVLATERRYENEYLYIHREESWCLPEIFSAIQKAGEKIDPIKYLMAGLPTESFERVLDENFDSIDFTVTDESGRGLVYFATKAESPDSIHRMNGFAPARDANLSLHEPGNLEIFDALMAYEGIDLSSRDKDGNTPISSQVSNSIRYAKGDFGGEFRIVSARRVLTSTISDFVSAARNHGLTIEDLPNNEGETALFAAVRGRVNDVSLGFLGGEILTSWAIKKTLEHLFGKNYEWLDRSQKNNEGQTAYGVASKLWRPGEVGQKIPKLLKRNGVPKN